MLPRFIANSNLITYSYTKYNFDTDHEIDGEIFLELTKEDFKDMEISKVGIIKRLLMIQKV